MYKFLLLFTTFLTASTGGADEILLELKPSKNGNVSEYRIVRNVPQISKSLRKGLTDDISEYNWVIQYDSEDWAYYTPRSTGDTMAVRFVSPGRCSLVAFTWISYCGATGTVGEPANVFVTDVGSVDYSTYPGVDESDSTTPSPLGAVQWSGVTACPANMVWDTVNVPTTYVDTLTNTFFCGWNPGVDGEAGLAESIIPKPDPIDCHTYYFSDSLNRWFAYYYTGDDEYIRLGMRAYVKIYSPPPIFILPDRLPDSYNTGNRKVNVEAYYGSASDSIARITLYYTVNNAPQDSLISTEPVSGSSSDGIWQFTIPGVNTGDTVNYYVKGFTSDSLTETSNTYLYTILEGTPGNFLYVVNDDDPADILPEYWEEQCDEWDISLRGMPDSSVITSYNTVVWRDWGCRALGYGLDLGSGIRRSDSTWIKLLLDNGGNFWLSDEDMGYGLGICPNYGQQAVGDMWVRNYLGIKGMWDDSPLSGASITATGNPADPVIGDLFAGIGNQTPGYLEICPEQPWVGIFDSLAPTATSNIIDSDSNVISFRYTGPSSSYKIYMDFFPFDWIVNPADTTQIDRVAVDSLVSDVLGWFGYSSLVIDRTIEPENVLKIYPVSPVLNEAAIRYYLPGGMTVSLAIYDRTGRMVRKLIDGKVGAGLNTVRWNCMNSKGERIPSGIYFCRLKTPGKVLSGKIIVLK